MVTRKLQSKGKIDGSKYSIKPPLEAYTRALIERRLESLGYNMDERDSECNVYRERAKFVYQDSLLEGRNPDFLIYEKGTSRILAVIEAKRPSKSLDEAIEQAIENYATPLNIPIIFVYNAGSFYACSKERIPVKIDNIEISDFVNEETLIQLIANDYLFRKCTFGFFYDKGRTIAYIQECE